MAKRLSISGESYQDTVGVNSYLTPSRARIHSNPNVLATTPATVGEYIAGVVVKELWATQLVRGCGRAFDGQLVKGCVARMSPTLANDILDAVRGWIPIADELSPTTLLPDLDEFPASVSEEDGITLIQRRLLLEALKIIFDVFNEESLGGSGGEGLNLPRASVANVSVQIVAMLEHISLTRPRGVDAQLMQNDLDFNAWQSLCAQANGKLQPGSKTELIEEVQQCRRQIFDLEKELVTQVKIADASANREKREAEKAVQRLISVNQMLEEKLRSRTEESRNLTQRICELERRIEHEQNKVDEKAKKIEMLQNELARTARQQDDLLLRERKYGERILALRMEEFMSICRDSQRKKRLENAIRGEMTDADEIEEVDEKDLVDLAEETLKKVQCEFNGYFEERQKNMLVSVQQCEEQISRERKQSLIALEHEWEQKLNAMDPLNVIAPAMRSARRRHGSDSLILGELSKKSVEVQTEHSALRASILTNESDHPTSPSNRNSYRGSICMADMGRKKTSVLMQAEVSLRQSARQSVHLAQPIRRSSLIKAQSPPPMVMPEDTEKDAETDAVAAVSDARRRSIARLSVEVRPSQEPPKSPVLSALSSAASFTSCECDSPKDSNQNRDEQQPHQWHSVEQISSTSNTAQNVESPAESADDDQHEQIESPAGVVQDGSHAEVGEQGEDVQAIAMPLVQLQQVCSCGNVFMADATFCRKCGAARSKDSSMLAVQLEKTCACGNIFMADARFCRNCGAARSKVEIHCSATDNQEVEAPPASELQKQEESSVVPTLPAKSTPVVESQKQAVVPTLPAKTTPVVESQKQAEPSVVPTPPAIPAPATVAPSARIRGKSLPAWNHTGVTQTQLEALRAGTPSTRASSRVDSRNESRMSQNSPATQLASPDSQRHRHTVKASQRKTIARMVLQFERTA